MLSTSTGQVSASTYYQTSDFIPVTPGTNYKFCDKSTFTEWTGFPACFYTANKTFISGGSAIGTTPTNAAYLRISSPGLNSNYGIFPSNVSYWSDFVSPQVYPIYKADLAKEYNREQNEQFFRATLEGKLTFQRDDYVWILAQAFDFEYILKLYISYNAGYSWEEYWTGNFWKTDCDFDEDSQTVTVQPTVKDQYTEVLAGIEKEFNLIDLAPEMTMIKADKRPMVQVYIPGDSTVGCFLAGMSWEQECDVVTDEDALVGVYNFALSASLAAAEVTSGTSSPQIPTIFTKRFAASKFNPREQGTQEFTASGYKLVYDYVAVSGATQYSWTIVRISDNTSMWRLAVTGSVPPELPIEVTLTPVSGSGASGNVKLYIHNIPVYCRYVLDVDTIMDQNTSLIPDNDIVENNRNYRRVIAYDFPECVVFSTNLSSTPTKWGLYQPGKYYQKPAGEFYYGEFFPVSRREWGEVSVWFNFSPLDTQIEEAGRKAYTIKNNYPLWSVISVLLGQIAPSITHEATTGYSEFLYSSTDPVIGRAQSLFLTPKSNILTADYDQPAQKAPITLRNVLDMLRDCFRLYWFIDSQNRFRIEHITWFMRGGSYSPSTNIAHDLTEEIVSRNGKPWAFARSQYKFDKPAMAERYEFGWMDDVTDLFEGFPIDIVSKYVTPGNIQQIKIGQFTSDIDYMLLNPGACSKDGFALLAAIKNNGSQTINATGGYRPFELKTGGVIVSFNIVTKILLRSTTGQTRTVRTADLPFTVPFDVKDVSAYSPGNEVTINYYDGLKLPYYNYEIDDNDHILQNAYVAFCMLQRYYVYDMPAGLYSINGVIHGAIGIKKLKTQSIKFPLLNDIDLNQLIKTTLGNGVIDKLSINLSSRNANATLKYDTE